ncbi:MFS transporter [Actinospica robiniae]|uniref:MFS transporter n=1 Tax=Actinospica robiniae TaxID=304901 RepID=UPI0004078CB5|nr:MFS transporter [Actinospica robiniae]
MVAFSFTSVETLPVGVLPLLESGLRISPERAGLLVTAYGTTVVLATLPLTFIAARIPRRPLILILLSILVVSTLASALAPGYGALFAARVVTALAQAMFWPLAAPLAALLFPLEQRGRATSVVFTGGSLGPMLGVPLGTWLGQLDGWRLAFGTIAGLELLALVAALFAVPSSPAHREKTQRGDEPSVVKYVQVLLITALTVAGLYSFFTYTASFLTAVTAFPAAAIGPVLIVRGIGDLGGTVVGGYLSDRNERLGVIVTSALFPTSLLGLYFFGHQGAATVILLTLTGFTIGAAIPVLSNRVMRIAPGSIELGGAGNATSFNVGIGLGSALGAATVAHAGIQDTALTGAGIATFGLLVALIAVARAA